MPVPTVYFYCYPQGSAFNAAYQHAIIALAEGLRELGVPFFSNINYWPLNLERDAFLFTHSPDVHPADCDVVVLNHFWFDYGYTMPPQLFHKGRQYVTVFIDHRDGVYTHSFRPAFRSFDVILKAHFNHRVAGYPANVQPWAFGLTSRIIDVTASAQPWEQRERVLLSNFRVHHGLRAKAKQAVYPLLSDMFAVDESTDAFRPPQDEHARFEWKKTGRRHNPAYYEKLKTSQAIACFGGFAGLAFAGMVQPQKLAAIIDRLLPDRMKAIYQWDSFRLWEAFAAGGLVFHIDLAAYGLQLPVMPENWKHYVGVDFKQLAATRTLLENQPERLEQIAANGRAWALEHYTPRATAQRFLSVVGLSGFKTPGAEAPGGLE